MSSDKKVRVFQIIIDNWNKCKYSDVFRDPEDVIKYIDDYLKDRTGCRKSVDYSIEWLSSTTSGKHIICNQVYCGGVPTIFLNIYYL